MDQDAKMHPIKDAPVHRFQPVAGVGQGASHDGREGIGEVALFERVAQIDRFGAPAWRRRRDIFSHGWRPKLLRCGNQISCVFIFEQRPQTCGTPLREAQSNFGLPSFTPGMSGSISLNAACRDGRGRDAAAAVEDVSVDLRGPGNVVGAQIHLTLCNCTPISAEWEHQADPVSVTPSQPGRALAI